MSFPVVNPATGETFRTHVAITEAEARSIVDQAHAAFLPWRRTDLTGRDCRPMGNDDGGGRF